MNLSIEAPVVTVQPVTIAQMEQNANFPALFREYAQEAAINDLPPPDEKLAQYRIIEPSGFLHVYGAFIGDRLIGVISVLLAVIPHYGVSIGVSESFFVAKAYRKSGAGLKLLRTAEQHARAGGAPALMVSAPVGGQLIEVLPHVGYHETNRVFLKRLSDA